MFHGVIGTLMDVMHILDLKRNLTSMGAVSTKGCKCTITSRVMNVVNEASVITGSVMVRNLNKLIEDAIPGGAVKHTSNNRGRNHIVQVELDATKSSEDRLMGHRRYHLVVIQEYLIGDDFFIKGTEIGL